jgi:hypothetical protein
MKAGTKATREAVFAACDMMMIEGKIPTVRAVCIRTGGSMSTITPLLKEWVRELCEGRRGNQPTALPDGLAQTFVNIWHAAVAQAKQRLDAEAAGLKLDAQSIQERATAAETETERVKARSAEVEDELAAARAQIANLNDQLSRRATEHGIVISSFTTLIDALKDQISTFGAEHSAELNRMTKDRERLTAQLETQQLEIARLKALQLSRR